MDPPPPLLPDEEDDEWARFSTLLRVGSVCADRYRRGKAFALGIIGTNLGYFVLYITLVVISMIYPLLGVLWILLFRAAIALAIVFGVRLVHKYVGDYVVACVQNTWSKN